MLSEVIYDRKDVILGAKGAGKSALWKEFKERQQNYPTLSDIYIRLVTNPSGDPEFRDVLRAISAEEFPDDDELRIAWRLYFLAQFWRAALEILPQSHQREQLDKRITHLGIVYRESNA